MCGRSGHVWWEWPCVGGVVTCGGSGHVWEGWSRVVGVAMCGRSGHVWWEWPCVGGVVTCGGSGHVWEEWSRVVGVATWEQWSISAHNTDGQSTVPVRGGVPLSTASNINKWVL